MLSAYLEALLSRLSREVGQDSPWRARMKWLPHLAFVALAMVFVVQMATVMHFAIDVPLWDEWDNLQSGQLGTPLRWSWIFGRHNEHLIAATRLQMWLLYRFNGWDTTSHVLFNQGLFASIVVLLAVLMGKALPRTRRWIAVPFLLFVLSPRLYLVHAWAFISQFHFALLFSLLAALSLFAPRQRWWQLAAGLVACALAIFSFSAGLAMVAVMAVVFVAFKVWRVRVAGHERRREIIQAAIIAAGIVTMVGLWLATMVHPQHADNYVWPFRADFWRYYLMLVSKGFIGTTNSRALRFLIFVVAAYPWLGELARRPRSAHPAIWPLAAVTLGILGALGANTVIRAGLGVQQAKSAQYVILSVALVPLSAAGWWVYLRDHPRTRAAALMGLWLFLHMSQQGPWDYDRSYAAFNARVRTGVACLSRYVEQMDYDGRTIELERARDCPSVYGRLSAGPLHDGLRLGLSFFGELEPSRRLPPRGERHTQDDGRGGLITSLRRLIVWWTFGRGDKDPSSPIRIDADEARRDMLPVLEPGDVILSGADGIVTHASVYVGDGRMVHAMATELNQRGVFERLWDLVCRPFQLMSESMGWRDARTGVFEEEVPAFFERFYRETWVVVRAASSARGSPDHRRGAQAVRALIGESYDPDFVSDNDSYYCSEIARQYYWAALSDAAPRVGARTVSEPLLQRQAVVDPADYLESPDFYPVAWNPAAHPAVAPRFAP